MKNISHFKWFPVCHVWTDFIHSVLQISISDGMVVGGWYCCKYFLFPPNTSRSKTEKKTNL